MRGVGSVLVGVELIGRPPKAGIEKQLLFRAGGGVYELRHLTPADCARLQGLDRLPVGCPWVGGSAGVYSLKNQDLLVPLPALLAFRGLEAHRRNRREHRIAGNCD